MAGGDAGCLGLGFEQRSSVGGWIDGWIGKAGEYPDWSDGENEVDWKVVVAERDRWDISLEVRVCPDLD